MLFIAPSHQRLRQMQTVHLLRKDGGLVENEVLEARPASPVAASPELVDTIGPSVSSINICKEGMSLYIKYKSIQYLQWSP